MRWQHDRKANMAAELKRVAALHQIDHTLLRFCVSLDIALRGAEGAMAGQHLHVSQRTTDC